MPLPGRNFLRRTLFGMPRWTDLDSLLMSVLAIFVRFRKHRHHSYREIREPSAFDDAYGVSTSGTLSWRALTTQSWSDAYGQDYEPIKPTPLRHVLGLLPDVRTFTFVDLGCGKGRATIIASEFPFKAIVGVEKSPELADIGRANARILGARHPQRPAIEIVTTDALDFTLPPGDLVLYLFNPFMIPVMRRLSHRIEQAAAESGRQVFLIYCEPRLRWLFDGNRALMPDPERSLIIQGEDERREPWTVAAWRGRED